MTENIGLKFLAILIAITLWAVVFGTKTIEITKDVPFEVSTNEDQGIEDVLPEKITFRLAGPKAFLTSITNRIEEPIRVNLKEMKPGLINYRIYSDAIKLPLGVKVQSINPTVIPIRIEEQKRKMVNIDLQLMGKERLGDRFVRADILPPQVRIKGPRNRLAAISSMRTFPIDISGLQHTTTFPLTFDFRAFGVELDSVLPELNVEVQGRGQAFRVKHVPLKVNATGKARCEESEVTVIVRTGVGENIKVDGEQVKAEIDARDLPEGEYLRWVKVQLPERVHLVRVIPPFAKIEVKGQ
jgi:YbbR domain-containing protein